MNRRYFLATTASIASLPLVAGCLSSDSNANPGDNNTSTDGKVNDGPRFPDPESVPQLTFDDLQTEEIPDGKFWSFTEEMRSFDSQWKEAIYDFRDHDNVLIQLRFEDGADLPSFYPQAIAVTEGTTVSWEWHEGTEELGLFGGAGSDYIRADKPGETGIHHERTLTGEMMLRAYGSFDQKDDRDIYVGSAIFVGAPWDA